MINPTLGVGCAGEIQLGEHEDYAAWTIDILVKFRDTEKLQLLTGQRQSGGVSRYISLDQEFGLARLDTDLLHDDRNERSLQLCTS